MRTYLYLLAGVTSALIGWNLGEFLTTDRQLLQEQQMKEVILFPCIAISLAIGMVLNEIFISSPTRPKLCWRKAFISVPIALLLGSLLGLVAGGISQLLYLPSNPIEPSQVRILSWLLVGFSVGLAEGLTWRWQSVEAGDHKRFWQRFLTSIFGASIASIVAALLFESIRSGSNLPFLFRQLEDPIGFSLLGLFLGLTFAFTNSPSYLAALRAGGGFEYTGEIYADLDSNATVQSKPYAAINKSSLKFVSDNEADEIEEGLSIQLPGKGTIIIGSDKNPKAQITLPGIPLHAAHIYLQGREARFKPNPQFFRAIALNGDRLTSRGEIFLKHNNVLTFYTLIDENKIDEEKTYRFVYYNRFLDPQA